MIFPCDFMFCIRCTYIKLVISVTFSCFLLFVLHNFTELPVFYTIVNSTSFLSCFYFEKLNRFKKNTGSVFAITYPHLHILRWKTLCHAMASRNLSMKEWFLSGLTAAVSGRTGVTVETVWLSRGSSCLAALMFRDPEALNIPSGWRHRRKPPSGQAFDISGRCAWMCGFFS